MDEPRELGGAAEQLVEGVYGEPRRRLGKPDRCAIAAVRPVRRVLADASGDGVPNDIQDGRDQMGITGHLDRVRPVLEQVRIARVPAIRSARVIAIQQLKPR